MGARGENIIHVEGREVPILFTNRALMGVEKRLKKSILAIADGFASTDSGMTEVIVLLHVGMEAARVDSRAGGKPVTMDDAYEVIDKVGFAAVAAPVMEAVAVVLGYSPESDIGEDGADPNA
jgi:hypothetical protein